MEKYPITPPAVGDGKHRTVRPAGPWFPHRSFLQRVKDFLLPCRHCRGAVSYPRVKDSLVDLDFNSIRRHEFVCIGAGFPASFILAVKFFVTPWWILHCSCDACGRHWWQGGYIRDSEKFHRNRNGYPMFADGTNLPQDTQAVFKTIKQGKATSDIIVEDQTEVTETYRRFFK